MKISKGNSRLLWVEVALGFSYKPSGVDFNWREEISKMFVSIQVDLISVRQQGPTTGYGTFEQRGMWAHTGEILELIAKWRGKSTDPI